MSNDEQLLEQARQRINFSIRKEEFRVFVFGPGMNPSEVVERPISAISTQNGLVEHAKYLRFLTTQKLRENGWTVDFGETQCLVAHFGDRAIAKNIADKSWHANDSPCP